MPLRLSWIVYTGLIVAVMIAIAFVPETIERKSGDLSLKPRVGVPAGIRLKFVAPAATAFVAFALGGFYAAIVPGLAEACYLGNSLPVFGVGLISLTIGRENAHRIFAGVLVALAAIALAAEILARRSAR